MKNRKDRLLVILVGVIGVLTAALFVLDRFLISMPVRQRPKVERRAGSDLRASSPSPQFVVEELRPEDSPTGPEIQARGSLGPSREPEFDARGTGQILERAPAEGREREGAADPEDERISSRPSRSAGDRDAVAPTPVRTPSRNREKTTARSEPGENDTTIDDDPETDIRPPVVSSIQFHPSSVSDGQETLLVVNVSDDLSGVKQVSGSVRSPGGKATLGVALLREGETDRYQAKVRIPERAEEGNWYVHNLRAMDQANNVATINYDASSAPAGARLTVNSSASDSTPPVLRGIQLDRKAIEPGQKNGIRLMVEDEQSGVQNVHGTFVSPSGNARVGFHCRLEEASGAWVGEIAPPKDAECGDWTIQIVSVSDRANNRKTYGPGSPELAGGVFFLSQGGTCDSVPPEMTMLSLSPTAVDNGQASEITVTAWVYDDQTGVRQVSGRVVGPALPGASPPTIHFQLRQEQGESAPWVGKLVVPQHAARGTWIVHYVQVIDRANNQKGYTPADAVLTGAQFTVD